jgi:hypothetical protein
LPGRISTVLASSRCAELPSDLPRDFTFVVPPGVVTERPSLSKDASRMVKAVFTASFVPTRVPANPDPSPAVRL